MAAGDSPPANTTGNAKSTPHRDSPRLATPHPGSRSVPAHRTAPHRGANDDDAPSTRLPDKSIAKPSAPRTRAEAAAGPAALGLAQLGSARARRNALSCSLRVASRCFAPLRLVEPSRISRPLIPAYSRPAPKGSPGQRTRLTRPLRQKTRPWTQMSRHCVRGDALAGASKCTTTSASRAPRPSSRGDWVA